jgi:hypothetical protein
MEPALSAYETQYLASRNFGCLGHLLEWRAVVCNLRGLTAPHAPEAIDVMQFFLYEIVARIVAIYLCVYLVRKVRSGLVERKITYSLLLDRSPWVANRDATPVRYWIQIGIHIQMLVGCLIIAILGWWHPNA